MRLLHTADWQIGKRFGQFEADEAALLAEARFEVVARLANLAQAEGVDLVLVAGDVFDAQGVADRTILRMFQAMAGFAGPWVMIPGNHDSALAESVWSRAARLGAIPPNVHVCLKAEPLVLQQPAVAILPAPLTQRHAYNDLTAWFDSAETPQGLPRIGLAHGSVQGILADDGDATNPIAADRAASAALDYLALGDWHGTRQIDARMWYSGAPETDRFRNNASGHALLVEIAAVGSEPNVQAVPVGRYRWSTIERALNVASDLDLLLGELALLGPADVVQLDVTGTLNLEAHLALNHAIAAAQARARSLVANLEGLRLQPTPEDIQALRADGYLGEAIDELRREGEGQNAELARDALGILAVILEQTRGGGDSGS